MRGQYQSIYNLLPISSYSNNFSSKAKIYDKDDFYNTVYNTDSFINDSPLTFSPIENKDYSIDIFDDSKEFSSYEESLASSSSTTLSSTSTISLPLSSSSTYSPSLSTPN